MSTLSKDLRSASLLRQQRLAALLARHKTSAILVSSEKDINYLTGFIGHDSLLLLHADASARPRAFIISDARYDEHLNPWRTAANTTVIMGTRHRLHEALTALCKKRKIRSLAFQADNLTVARHQAFASALKPAKLISTAGLVAQLRMLKDALELKSIQHAISIQQEALAVTLSDVPVGTTEMQLSARLDFEMKFRGASGSSFTSIIGAGPNSAIPHHETGSTPIAPGVLLIDWGAVYNGYCSDMTRTFVVGVFPRKIRDIYPIVLEAQMAAIASIAPGKTCSEIDAVARRIITKAGYGKYFNHGLGHSFGMDIHESPFFNSLQTDVTLQPGMVMTVEPGIYLPGVGGVRIEDDILVTGNGVKVLSSWPKDLNAAILNLKHTARRSSGRKRR
ncbi:MAG TPA: Xaa-Pro peptidase family protein [Phycisphaerales bacterium]|nr:Xaa-Pro peptidase family protein [Phycisphaerales bacterium]